MFDNDDGSLKYAHDAGIYTPGVEASIGDRSPLDPAQLLLASPRVFLCFGQSNAANHGLGSYTPKRGVFCFNQMDSSFYAASDPLPGATGNGGSVWGRFGDALIHNPSPAPVVIATIAFGGSYIADWSPGGPLNRRLIFAIQRMLRSKLQISAMLWWQGEAEANLSEMKRERYKSRFLALVRQVRDAGIGSPFFVARSTLCATEIHPYDNRNEIRSAQAELVDRALGIFSGPDTDQIGLDGRFDGCHFNEAGLASAARLWADVITGQSR